MAVANGFGKTVTSGSVFMYDTGDDINSFKGQPKTNLLTTISKVGTNNDTYFKTNSGTEIKFVPNVGIREVHYVNIFNDYYGGSSNCCPAPMHFGDFTISPATTYTYQIIYRTTTGYANPNYMYHYEFNSGTYVTEYGLWDSSRQTELGDGWKHAWGTFTSNASANRFITYLFHYEYAVWNKIEVAGVMLTQGSNIIPPRQFVPLASTRSTTQGLLPIISNSTINLSNVSFDTNGQMVFDGTDDLIDIDTNFGVLNAYTFEYVAYSNSGGNMPISSRTSTAFYKYGAYSWRYTHGGVGGEFYHTYGAETGWAHWVITYDGSTISIWENGVSKGTTSSSGTADFSGGIRIGSWASSNSYTWDGKIPIMKMYNRALSAAEVRQNYNKYKTRFNLP